MTTNESTLHLMFGKIASGKSTLARRLAANPDTVLLCEDRWLSQLYPDEMRSIEDYVRYSSRLRDAIGPHVVELLVNGVSVVLDFPANTPETRAWMRRLIIGSDARHKLHVLDVPDETCLRRVAERNERGDHEFKVSVEQFHRINRHISPPLPGEGFDLVVHGE